MNRVNMGKHTAETHAKHSVLTYDQLTVNPAQVLGVVDPFLENSPAGNRHTGAAWENIS